jgi:hypothetical protein
MSNEPKSEVNVDKAGAEAIMIKVAGMLLKGASDTNDPRLLKMSGVVIEELKKSNILETLLIAFANQEQNPSTPPTPNPFAEQLLGRQVVNRRNQLPNAQLNGLNSLMEQLKK